MISWCVFRYVVELCFPLVRHLWCFCLNVSMMCWREWDVWMFGNWRFTSKCSCLKSAPLHHTAPDKSSHNFFSRHAAIRHKIYEKYSWKPWLLFRYICVWCFPLVRHLWCFCMNVCMMCSRLCCAWMLGTEDLPLNVHVWRVHWMHQVHQINQVIIFSVGTRQFGTKFMKNHMKTLMLFRYICVLCLWKSYSFCVSSGAYSADIDIFHWCIFRYICVFMNKMHYLH